MDSIIFSLKPDEVAQGQYAAIVSPGDSSWDDFGYQIRIDIRIPNSRQLEKPLLLAGYFAFVDDQQGKPDVSRLRQLLRNVPGGSIPSAGIPKFFTMLPDMGAYREIVSALGPDTASSLLASMNDVVATSKDQPNSSLLRNAKDTRIFKEAFLRTSESFFAFSNAGPILRGLEYEKFGQISEKLKLQFKLAGRPNQHELNFKFDIAEQMLPRRFSIVIGKNGVGKSQALGHIAKAALRGSRSLTDGNDLRPSLNRLLAFAPTSGTASIFPSERTKSPKVWYRRFVVNTHGSIKSGESTAALIRSLARSEERIGDSDRFEIFMRAISAIDRWEEIGILTNSAFNGKVRLQQLRIGSELERLQMYSSVYDRKDPVRIVDGRKFPLSSGEQSFLRIAALASLYIENGSLLLFDEPETHLHPDFISQLVAVLDSLLKQTGSAAIIATHSVYFVRETFEDQVIVLRSDEDRRIWTEQPALKTFGADVGSISYFVFGEDRPSRLALEVEDRIAQGLNTWDQIFEEFKDELSLELLGEIRDRVSSGNSTSSP